jgi:hypothetical protein
LNETVTTSRLEFIERFALRMTGTDYVLQRLLDNTPLTAALFHGATKSLHAGIGPYRSATGTVHDRTALAVIQFGPYDEAYTFERYGHHRRQHPRQRHPRRLPSLAPTSHDLGLELELDLPHSWCCTGPPKPN